MEQRLKCGGDGYYEEKKSKFIAKAYVVNSQEEVDAFLAAARKQYYDARHNCYAYAMGSHGETVKSSDDGEPSGTAGKPILEIITGAHLTNCLIIVTRYFGGTLLGTGGLVRAYQKSAKDALAHSEIVSIVEGERYEILTDYNSIGKLQRILSENEDTTVVDTIYTDVVTFVVDIQKSGSATVIHSITEETAGKAKIQKVEDRFIELCTPYSES